MYEKVFIVTLLCLMGTQVFAESGNLALQTLIENKLLKPLKKQDENRPRFSRAGPPAEERRLRFLDEKTQSDFKGREFVRFAIDERYRPIDPKNPEAAWEKEGYKGCVYLNSNEIWISSYDKKYYPGSLILGDPGASKQGSESMCQKD